MADCDNNKVPSASNPMENNLIPPGLSINPDADVFNVNSVLSAVQTYNALNYVANKLIGMDVKWFRAIPQQRAKDIMFQEYTLSNVEETPLCVKVVLPGGNFPDSKYNFDLMGLEYEIPLEVHIDKKYWENIAGFGTAPQKKDIVYFVAPNKLYQVESAYLFRGFMEQETTWKLNFRKYMPESSRRESDALRDTIDQYTADTEELFGPELDANTNKIVDDKQFSPMNSTSKDKFKYLDKDLKIITLPINIYGTTVSQSYYDMNTAETPISYVGKDPISVDMDRSITLWTMPRTVDSSYYEIDHIETIPYVGYSIKVKTATQFKVGDTFVISRAGALNFYANVIDISANHYICEIDRDVENYMSSMRSDWQTLTNYKMQVKSPINLLDGIDTLGNHSLSVNLYANQFIRINYGAQKYVAIIDEKLNDNKWYGFVVNIGNTWKQYNVYVWETHDTDEFAKLQIKYYETMNFTPEYIDVDHYVINKSPSYLTNIRLYTATIEEERQSNSLLSYFIKDGDQAIIADNADPRLRAPYITKQR